MRSSATFAANHTMKIICYITPVTKLSAKLNSLVRADVPRREINVVHMFLGLYGMCRLMQRD